jgi:hypothetical protein
MDPRPRDAARPKGRREYGGPPFTLLAASGGHSGMWLDSLVGRIAPRRRRFCNATQRVQVSSHFKRLRFRFRPAWCATPALRSALLVLHAA